MRTLYVSDLDGTLLNSKKEITPFTAETLNAFIARGGLFTVATARMAYGCDYKLKDIRLNVPGIIMNGACLYSFHEKKYLDVKAFKPHLVSDIENCLNGYTGNAFMYTYRDGKISIFHTADARVIDAQYLSKRAYEECAQITKTDSLAAAAQGRSAIYFALTDERGKIEQVLDNVKRLSGVQYSAYTNIYNDLTCLEIFDEAADKANALKDLKRLLGVKKTAAFGDNHNDVKMLLAADFRYAPENAVDEVKRIAHRIVPNCDSDGVATYLKKKFRL